DVFAGRLFGPRRYARCCRCCRSHGGNSGRTRRHSQLGRAHHLTRIALGPGVAGDDVHHLAGDTRGVNLRQIWLIAIALAGVSFLGYLGVRVFGARQGILLSSAAGGLVSSTAVTVTNALRGANEEAHPVFLAAGVATASGISFLRVIVIVAALQPALLWLIAPALLVATLLAGVAVFLPLRGQTRRTKPATFAFWSVIAFAI